MTNDPRDTPPPAGENSHDNLTPPNASDGPATAPPVYGQPSHGLTPPVNSAGYDSARPSEQSPQYDGYRAAPTRAPGAPGKGFAITALVLGIVALITFWLPGFPVVVAIVAIVFGIVALVKKQSKPMSITGLVLAALGAIASIIFWVMVTYVIGQAIQNVEPATYEFGATVSTGSAQVTYQIDEVAVAETFTDSWSQSPTDAAYAAVVTVTAEDSSATVTCSIVGDNGIDQTLTGTGSVDCATFGNFG